MAARKTPPSPRKPRKKRERVAATPEPEKPQLVQVPEMQPCPGCGLLLQLGSDPNGRAWHDCDRVKALATPVTLEGLEQATLRRMHALIETATAKDALAMHREITAARKPAAPPKEEGGKQKKGAKASGRLLSWVNGPEQ